MKFEIRHRHSGAVLFALETESLKLCVEAAVNVCANLRGANLRGANLWGANLADPDGKKITAIGVRPLLVLGPLGSRADYLQAWLTDAGVYIRTGCFWDRLAKFKSAVKTTHGTTTVHVKEYALAIKLIEAHARMWKPKKEKAK